MEAINSKKKQIEVAVRSILDAMGADIKDPNFYGTPERVAKFLLDFSKKPARTVPSITTFPSQNTGSNFSDLVRVSKLSVRSMCAHHLAPFFGHATVEYIPNDVVAGLSKFQRVLDWVAMQPCNQEELTNRYASVLVAALNPQYLRVTIRCQHTCMIVRGVQNPNSYTTTSHTYGQCPL